MNQKHKTQDSIIVTVSIIFFIYLYWTIGKKKNQYIKTDVN